MTESASNLMDFLNFNNLMMDNLNDLIIIINTKREIEYVNNPSLFHLLGYDKNELERKKINEYIHNDDKDIFNQTFEKMFKEGADIQEIRLRCKNGEYIWVEMNGIPIEDERRAKKLILISKDITHDKMLEQKLKQVNLLEKEDQSRINK